MRAIGSATLEKRPASCEILPRPLGLRIDPRMDQKLKALNRKLDDILKPYQTGYPINYNHYFTETIQKVREERHEAEIPRKLRRCLGHM